MDFLDLMDSDGDRCDKSLDRLEAVIALFDHTDDAVQDEALARAIGLCGSEWGGYKAGLEALARRRESAPGNYFENEMAALRLREEADDPGLLIRIARQRRGREETIPAAERDVIARYGSREAALLLTPEESALVRATCHLVDADESEDPWAPLAGWSLAWHPIPQNLKDALAVALPWPASVQAAKTECLAWENRLREREILTQGPGGAALPVACMARRMVVEELWRQGLPVRTVRDMEARMEYWEQRGADDGAGYRVLLADLRGLMASGTPAIRPEGTRERACQLKAEHPSWSLAQIGAELGISRQAVHKHLIRSQA